MRRCSFLLYCLFIAPSCTAGEPNNPFSRSPTSAVADDAAVDSEPAGMTASGHDGGRASARDDARVPPSDADASISDLTRDAAATVETPPGSADASALQPTRINFTQAPEVVLLDGFQCEAAFGSEALDWRVLTANAAGENTLFAPIVTDRKLTGSAVRPCTDVPGAVLRLPNVTLASEAGGVPISNGLRVAANDPAESGGYFIAGNTASGDVALLKFDLAGKLVWAKQVGGDAFESVAEVRVTKTGVYLAGNSDGLLPGRAPASQGLPFVARFDLAGAVQWTAQPSVPYGDTLDSSLNLMLEVDAAENAYLFDKSTLVKIAPSGELAWHTRWTREATATSGDLASSAALPERISSIRVFPAAHGSSVWLAAAGRSEAAQPPRDDVYLLEVDARGQQERVLVLQLGHDQPLDRESGTLWHGRIDGPALRLIDGPDYLYVLTGYLNDYELGTPPSGAYAEAVFKLSLTTLSVVWAKQYRAKPPTPDAQTVLAADYVRALDDGGLSFGIRRGVVAMSGTRESSPLRTQLRPSTTGVFRVTSTGLHSP